MTPPSKYRNKFNRKSSVRSTAKYLIFAEGTKTEQNYFSANELKRCLRNSNFEVVI